MQIQWLPKQLIIWTNSFSLHSSGNPQVQTLTTLFNPTMFGNLCLRRESPALISRSFIQPFEDFNISKFEGRMFILAMISLLLSVSFSSHHKCSIQSLLGFASLSQVSFHFNSLLILIQLAAVPSWHVFRLLVG